jgi:hypothetical protein
MGGSVSREFDCRKTKHGPVGARARVESSFETGVNVKEGFRRTSAALALLAVTALIATGGCGKSLGELIYNDSLLCGTADQACAPDGGRFDLHIVDRTTYQVANPSVPTFDMALKPGTAIVGFAFVERSPRQDSGVLLLFPDSGVVDYDIMYAEFDTDAGVALGAQRVQTVQRFFGVSLAYQANGDPAVAYLGGPLAPAGSALAQAFWFQNDAAIAYRSGGVWAEQVAAADSSPPFSVPTTASSDQGQVVGFYPALLFQGNNAVLAYRDGHNGQSAGVGDWQSSDLEMAIGGPTAWTPVALLQAGNNKRAYGAHNRIIPGAKTLNTGPRAAAVISDRAGSGPDTFGQDLEFSEQQPDGITWLSTGAITPVNSNVASILGSNGASILPNTQAGPSIDYRDNWGYAVAVTDRSNNAALFTYCAAGADCTVPGNWAILDPVYQQGTGGWYVSTAISPAGDPSVAYYVCSKQNGRNENTCTGDDFLAVANRGVSLKWSDHQLIVDTGPAFQTRMLFLGDRRVIGYRNGASGVLQIAIEKP